MCRPLQSLINYVLCMKFSTIFFHSMNSQGQWQSVHRPQTLRSISQITSARNHGWNLGCKNFHLFFLPNEMALWKCCRFGYSIKIQPAKFMSYLEAINFQFNLISDFLSNMITLPLWCSAYAAVVCLLELPTTWQEHGKHSSSLQNPRRKQGQTDSK